MPGFRPAIGFTLVYLSLIVLIPLSAMLLKTLQLGLDDYWRILTNDRVLASFRVSFGSALIAAAVACVFGFVIAWTLVRYPFPGKKLFDAMIDLPFALPTAVAGIVLATLYEPRGLIGKFILDGFAYKPAGIIVALIFIGLPFVVRTIEPVLQEFDASMEEAAASLGATRWQAFVKVILPNILPATLTGFALAFARGVGEYGSVIFIAGNMPYISEVVPLLIITKLEQYDYTGATAIGLTMLLVSFVLLLSINWLQGWVRRRSGQL
ncbi:MAG: sulfate ABC transporter permease subunit CysT [Methylomicrobium sp.]